MRVVLEVIERHELHDVSFHVFLESARVQGFFVAIERVHVGKVSIANSNDDNRQRKTRTTHNLVNRLSHVVDDSVGDQQKDLELLIHLSCRL